MIVKTIFKKVGEKLKKRGVEINVSLKIGNDKIVKESNKKVICPIYFIEKEN